ncbi:MAG: PIG-L deacetylase family protein [Betaproteobacteria bacterium]
MKFSSINRCLVLAPHTDDGEFGCGGTIAKLIDNNVNVIYVAFSAAEASVPPGYDRDILRREVLRATSKLGIPQQDCICLNYEVRKFPQFRQEILEDMISLNKKYQPELVILPSKYDTHQDHLTIHNEGFRAFKKTTMLGYEVPWNNLEFKSNCFVELSKYHLDRKIQAMAEYESQKDRTYASKEFLRALAVTRGIQIGIQYAECFEIIRMIS